MPHPRQCDLPEASSSLSSTSPVIEANTLSTRDPIDQIIFDYSSASLQEEEEDDKIGIDIPSTDSTPFSDLISEETSATNGKEELLINPCASSAWPRNLICSTATCCGPTPSESGTSAAALPRRRCFIGRVFVQFSRVKYFFVDTLGPTLKKYFISIFVIPFGSGFASAISQHLLQLYRQAAAPFASSTTASTTAASI